jgi:hypothetical protein
MNFLPEMNFSETAEELSVSSRSASSRPLISPCMHFNMSASPLGLSSGPLLAANLLNMHGFPNNLIFTTVPLASPYSMPALQVKEMMNSLTGKRNDEQRLLSLSDEIVFFSFSPALSSQVINGQLAAMLTSTV